MGVSALILFRNYNVGTQQIMGGSPSDIIPNVYRHFKRAHCPEQAILEIIKENGNVLIGKGENKLFTGYDFSYNVWYTGKLLFVECEDILADYMIEDVINAIGKENVKVKKEPGATLFELKL